MAAQIAGVIESSLREKINRSKILVVGAGGIGCEVLKNLVMSGFSDIEIIDLDTIDVSNLNRQFLFHREHVGRSKAEVARESALAFNPNGSIKAYHDSITTTKYGVNFFQKFGLVLNALDNRQARNHVNRMCLTSGVPLIESGTSGYDGQVELIKKGKTQCYECTPKAAQKSYPGCTIRNTPSEPIHCIVWAKHLFNQLFGEHNEDEDVSPDTADPEAVATAGDVALNQESNNEGNVIRISTRQWAQDTNYNPAKIFNKLFCDDIKYLLSMSDLWKKRTPPKPMQYGAVEEEDSSSSVEKDNLTGSQRDQKIWSVRECQNVFTTSLADLQTEFSKLAVDDHLVWDKDDKASMDFVAACTNVRARIFHIPQKSRFEIKSMAGNIIPAIATTNAITAGIVVMRSLNVLQDRYDCCQSVYIRLRPNARNQIFVPERELMPPNPKCIVCSTKPEVIIKIDTCRVTVKQFNDEVMKKSLNMIEPEVTGMKGTVYISADEEDNECNNDKLLADFGIVDGCILKADDSFQNYELTVVISHKNVERESQLFEIIADLETLKAEKIEPQKTEGEHGNGEPKAKKARHTENIKKEEDSDDDFCIIDEDGDDAADEFGGKWQGGDVAVVNDNGEQPDIDMEPTENKNQQTEGLSSASSSLLKRSRATDDGDHGIILIED